MYQANDVSGRSQGTSKSLREDPAALLRMVAKERKSSRAAALFQLVVTLVLYGVSLGVATWSFNNGYWAAILLVPLIAGFLIRLFILQHDCGHRSFFTSTKANDFVGSLLGILTMTPYHPWRRFHAMHHATSGDLDRRGKGGEIWAMTLQEYVAASPGKRFRYRLYRNPLIMFGIGPFYQFAIVQRTVKDIPKTWKRERISLHLTNLGIFAFNLALILLMGWKTYLILQLPAFCIAASVGVWLFYVQHQFEDAYYHPKEEWNYALAALDGSSYYRLPKILQWFTGNIGIHHIHHLDSKIPNYRLPHVLKSYPELKAGNEITLWESLRCVSAKLWDENQGKMIGFPRGAELKRLENQAAQAEKQKAKAKRKSPTSSAVPAFDTPRRKSSGEPVEAA